MIGENNLISYVDRQSRRHQYDSIYKCLPFTYSILFHVISTETGRIRNYHSNSHPLSWFVIQLIGLNQSQLVKDKAEKLPR